MTKKGYVYIITNKPNGTLYVGVTSDLEKRIWQHKQKQIEGFSQRYGLDMLAWYQEFSTIDEAIEREKKMKKRKRQWKINRIEASNSQRADLAKNRYE